MIDHDLPGCVRLLGGELPTWSDLTSSWEPAQRGAQLPIVLAAVAGRSRVLVAGPHEPDLLMAVANAIDGELTCLVRSIPDARLLGEVFERSSRGRLRVLCGSLERCDEVGYDAVVALDDVCRLYSTEGPEPTFGTALADLRRLLAADGVLVLTVDNQLGLHWLTADVQPESDSSEAAWSRPPTADETRPRGITGLAEQFGSGAEFWPVYPVPSAPVVAWGPAAESVDRAEYAGLFEALSDLATRSLERVRPSVDVASLMRRIWRSGRLAEFAGGWLVVAGQGTAQADVVAWMVAEQDEPIPVRRRGDGCLVLPNGSEVPTGQLLSDVMMQAVVAPDQAALRSAIRGYADWLATLTDVASASADRVVVGTSGEHRLLALARPDPGAIAKTADEQLLVAVADLVRRVERHGRRRTWPSHLTPAEAVAWVAAMRGEPVPDDVVARVTADAGLDRPVASYSRVPAAVRAAAERFEESNASRARWFESRLKMAEKQLAAAPRELERIRRAQKGGRSSRVARMRRSIRARLRSVKRIARRVVHRLAAKH